MTAPTDRPDTGLTQAIVRVQEALDREGQELPWRDCEVAARAARADYPDVDAIVRNAKAEALDEAARIQRAWAEADAGAGVHKAAAGRRLVAMDLTDRAAAIREGRTDGE